MRSGLFCVYILYLRAIPSCEGTGDSDRGVERTQHSVEHEYWQAMITKTIVRSGPPSEHVKYLGTVRYYV